MMFALPLVCLLAGCGEPMATPYYDSVTWIAEKQIERDGLPDGPARRLLEEEIRVHRDNIQSGIGMLLAYGLLVETPDYLIEANYVPNDPDRKIQVTVTEIRVPEAGRVPAPTPDPAPVPPVQPE